MAASDDQLMSVFVPPTPNPTSGDLLFFPKKAMIELQMRVEDAAKLVISAGLVYPTEKSIEPEHAVPGFSPGQTVAGGTMTEAQKALNEALQHRAREGEPDPMAALDENKRSSG